MTLYLLQILWFLLPAAVANSTPPFASKLLPGWNTPMDFGVKIAGHRLFGHHKTVRGLTFGVIAALGIHWLQNLLTNNIDWLQPVTRYPMTLELWWLGGWMGFCALLGDALKSTIKRQLSIAPGKPWLPWDKIDWVIGAIIGVWFILGLSLSFALSAVLVGLILSTVGRVIGYWIKVNREWL